MSTSVNHLRYQKARSQHDMKSDLIISQRRGGFLHGQKNRWLEETDVTAWCGSSRNPNDTYTNETHVQDDSRDTHLFSVKRHQFLNLATCDL